MTKQPNHAKEIVTNRVASHKYFLEETVTAGLLLEGWEVKAIRAHRISLRDSYVTFLDGIPLLLGTHIAPLSTASSHRIVDPYRTRRLLLKKRQIESLKVKAERKGYTIVLLNCYWKGPWIKATLALARGKKEFDIRRSEADQAWKREQAHLLKKRTLKRN